MKKYLAILTVLALAGISPVNAELLGIGKIQADGSLEILGISASNEDDASSAGDHRGGTVSRIRLGLGAEITEGVNGRVEFLRNSNSGANVQFGDNAVGGNDIDAETNGISIENAYIDIDTLFNLDLFRIGRHYGGREDDPILYYGPTNDDSLSVTALDGLLVEKKFKKINVSFLTAKVNEDDAVAATDADTAGVIGDVNINAVIIGSDKLVQGYKVPLELGIYQRTQSFTVASNDNDNRKVYDLRGSILLMEDALEVGLEYAMNDGKLGNAGAAAGNDREYTGNLMVLCAAYKCPKTGLKATLHYANASGDDATGAADDNDEDESFRDIGFSDRRYGEILGRDTAFGIGGGATAGFDTGAQGMGFNIIDLALTYPLPMNDKVELGVEYLTAKVNEVAANIDDGVGDEIDLTIKYKHSKNVCMEAGYASFSPDQGLLNNYAAAVALPDDSVTKAFAKLKVKWGGEKN